MASTPTSSMGELAQMVPDEDEKEAFLAIIQSIRANYPEEWEEWKVVDYSYEDLFGRELSPKVDAKLRFGIPTTELVRAFNCDAKGLSERTYRQIRRIILRWPLGRAILYSPHSIVEKIHAPSYGEFMAIIREMKVQGKLTNRERTSHLLGSLEEGNVSVRTTSSTPTSLVSRSKAGSTMPVGSTHTPIGSKRRAEEHSEVPPLKRTSSQANDDILSSVLRQQMVLFNKLIEMQAEQNKKIEGLQSASKHPTHDLDASFESLPDSTQSDGELEGDGSSQGSSDYEIPPSAQCSASHKTDAEQAIRNEIADAERRLQALRSSRDYNFKPHTTEAEAKCSKADPTLARQGEECQRLGSEGWRNVQYKEVQKKFQASPVFTALKVNNQFAEHTPNWSSVALLERFDLVLGAISNGLLQQRQIFEELLEKLPNDVREKVGNKFLANNSDFRRNSDDLLQYVCGRRSEVIQHRRDAYKIKNKILHEAIHSIPPSNTHLFKEPELSQAVKDQGGIHKFFPFKKPAFRSAKPSQRSYHTKKYSSRRPVTKYNRSTATNLTYDSFNKRSQVPQDKQNRAGPVARQGKWKGPKRS